MIRLLLAINVNFVSKITHVSVLSSRNITRMLQADLKKTEDEGWN